MRSGASDWPRKMLAAAICPGPRHAPARSFRIVQNSILNENIGLHSRDLPRRPRASSLRRARAHRDEHARNRSPGGDSRRTITHTWGRLEAHHHTHLGATPGAPSHTPGGDSRRTVTSRSHARAHTQMHMLTLRICTNAHAHARTRAHMQTHIRTHRRTRI